MCACVCACALISCCTRYPHISTMGEGHTNDLVRYYRLLFMCVMGVCVCVYAVHIDFRWYDNWSIQLRMFDIPEQWPPQKWVHFLCPTLSLIWLSALGAQHLCGSYKSHKYSICKEMPCFDFNQELAVHSHFVYLILAECLNTLFLLLSYSAFEANSPPFSRLVQLQFAQTMEKYGN